MFEFEKFKIEGLVLVKNKVFEDPRGYFAETYRKNEFFANGIDVEFVQENESYSEKNVLRGLHFQKKPKEQSKLIRCVEGKILDVAVDLRLDSKTFKMHQCVVLSSENKFQFFIPKGFAHGFIVLSDFAKVVYKTDEYYSPEHDLGILFCDKTLAIDWKFSENPIISEKDRNLMSLEKYIQTYEKDYK